MVLDRLRSRGFALILSMLLVLNVVVFAVLLAFGDPAITSSWWLAILVMLGPTVACFARAVVGGPRRAAAAAWLGIAMLSWSAGNFIYLRWTQFQADPPVPSPADLC